MLTESCALSPVPKKRSLRSSPMSSPAAGQELSSTRPFWYKIEADQDDDAVLDLNEEMVDVFMTPNSKKMLPDFMPAFEARCLSSASTAAETISPPLSPSPPCSPEWTPTGNVVDLNDDIDLPRPEKIEVPKCPPGALDKTSWLQARKLFVGGLPQTVDQNGLYQMFSKFGKVKKAWLQQFHSECGAGQAQAGKKHRGFGFVVFYEKHAIDQLLGDQSSQFVCFGDSLKLEVKRAVGKDKSPQEQASATKVHKAPVPVGLQARPVVEAASPQVRPVCSSPFTSQDKSEVFHEFHSTASTPSANVLGGIIATPSQIWQSSPSQPQTVVVSFAYVSPVPPFPFSTLADAQTSSPAVKTLPRDASLTSHPVQQVQAAAASNTTYQLPAVAPQSPLQDLSNVLLDGYCGYKPQSSDELTKVLLQAMPDHYED